MVALAKLWLKIKLEKRMTKIWNMEQPSYPILPAITNHCRYCRWLYSQCIQAHLFGSDLIESPGKWWGPLGMVIINPTIPKGPQKPFSLWRIDRKTRQPGVVLITWPSTFHLLGWRYSSVKFQLEKHMNQDSAVWVGLSLASAMPKVKQGEIARMEMEDACVYSSRWLCPLS